MKRKIIYVDANGISQDGEDFDLAATPEAINAGFMINAPVTLVFPDGRRLDTNQAKITPAGLATMARAFGKRGSACHAILS